IANTRKDYIHKITTEVCKNHAEIYVEDLKIANMSKSAKGTQEAHGKNVKAKSGLNKSILDQSWHQFRSQLEYKSHWHGGLIIAIDPKHTSQRCSKCDHIEKGNRQTQEKFKCVLCGFSTNADINAACNILAAGRAVSVCEANHISGRQQKPRGTRKKVPA
ncbi:RNA-guided endonuclease TnpB family protein, partial [Thiotrichales bacterium 19S11-10]|nr:RNA-guided endonuclease TnpB family protein [Thiotrichales bacterium 19S11-10]